MSSQVSAEVQRLHRVRPRDRVVRWSVWILGLLALGAWLSGEIEVVDLFSSKRRSNLERFLTEEVLPFPLRETGFTWSGFASYLGEIFSEHGVSAFFATLWMSILAIVLAAGIASVLMPFANRMLVRHEPYLASSSKRGLGWSALTAVARVGFILLRSIPEYVWAFLFLAMLGPSAWPAVLALALHNAGILGRLGADTAENLDAAPLRALRMAGANRRQLTAVAVFPLALPRLLLYFFYRFETCVREATVLGMLGVVSLGYWIQDARARHFYDDMLVFVALGSLLVIIADLFSHLARSWIRRAV